MLPKTIFESKEAYGICKFKMTLDEKKRHLYRLKDATISCFFRLIQ